MKTQILTLAFGAICLITTSVVLADGDKCVFQGNILTPDQIEKNVQTLGLTIKKHFFEKDVKLSDDCVYKTEATDSAGQQWKLFFDPSTGKLIGKKPD